MGDAAEDMLDGSVCEGCGEWHDDVLNGAEPPGYPRRCEACEPIQPRPSASSKRRRKRRQWWARKAQGAGLAP